MSDLEWMRRGFDAIGGKIPGNNVLFLKLWGSRSHNTHLPDSDWDFVGLYALPTKDILSIEDQPETIDGHEPDFSMHEAKKFAKLIVKGNPGIIECLFTDTHIYVTTEWLELQKHRDSFLTEGVVKQYLGYAEAQLKKLFSGGGLHTKGGTYNTKWAYHLLRLLGDADLIASGKHPLVWKETDSEERTLLMDVRHGRYSPEAIETLAKARMHKIESMKPWSVRKEPDIKILNEWLLNVRQRFA